MSLWRHALRNWTKSSQLCRAMRCTLSTPPSLPTLLEERNATMTQAYILLNSVQDGFWFKSPWWQSVWDQCCRSDKHHLHDDGRCMHVHSICVSLNINASMFRPSQPLLPTCDSLSQSSDKINMVWYAQPVKNRERMGMACCYASLQFVFRPCWSSTSTCVMLSLHLVSQCGWDIWTCFANQNQYSNSKRVSIELGRKFISLHLDDHWREILCWINWGWSNVFLWLVGLM